METREMQYFVAVADELHFGRAAERLGISQPPLSRAIRQLEVRLGTDVFTRTSRGVELTPPGEVLLRESRAALAAVAAAERRTRRAAATEPTVLVVKSAAAGPLVTELLERHAADPDAAPVRLDPCAIGEQVRTLRDGRADAAVLHLPYDDLAGLDYVELGRESQLVFVAKGHPQAGAHRSRWPRSTRSPPMRPLHGGPIPRAASPTARARLPAITVSSRPSSRSGRRRGSHPSRAAR